MAFLCSAGTGRSSCGLRTGTRQVRTRPIFSSQTGWTDSEFTRRAGDRGRRLIPLYLAKVVLQVSHVVRHEIVERCRLVSWNGFPCQLVEVMPNTRAEALLGRSRLHDAGDVKV